MIPTSIGDLAHTLVLRTRSVSIKTQIETLTQELASGQTTDIASRLDGDFAHLADMDRGLKRLAAFATSSAEAALFTDAVQDSLTNIHDRVDALSVALTSIGSFGQQINRDQVSNQAEAELQFILSSLNTSVGGRSLFAGMDTDRTPVAPADVLLSAVRTAVAGQTTPGDIVQAATDWFNDPAGFDAVIYAGSDQTLAPMQVSDSEQIRMAIRADDPAFKDVLRDIALAALATDPALNLAPNSQSFLIQSSGERLLNSRDHLIGMRAEVGFAQNRIAEARTRNASAQTSLDYTRAALLHADPYDVATRLEAAQFQLESLYSATVRNSRLSLVNFLR